MFKNTLRNEDEKQGLAFYRGEKREKRCLRGFIETLNKILEIFALVEIPPTRIMT